MNNDFYLIKWHNHSCKKIARMRKNHPRIFQPKYIFEMIFKQGEIAVSLPLSSNLYVLFKDLECLKPNVLSLCNFIQHSWCLESYLNTNYRLSVNQAGQIRLSLSKKNVFLILLFKENGLISFFSYDKDPLSKKDILGYSMKGSFCSSSNYNKSYKFLRLLAVLM